MEKYECQDDEIVLWQMADKDKWGDFEQKKAQ